MKKQRVDSARFDELELVEAEIFDSEEKARRVFSLKREQYEKSEKEIPLEFELYRKKIEFKAESFEVFLLFIRRSDRKRKVRKYGKKDPRRQPGTKTVDF